MKRAALLALAGGLWLRAAGLWLDVPFVKQAENGCGSAALAMLMRYWRAQGAPVDAADGMEARIQSELYSPAERGIPARAMERYLNQHGFRVVLLRGEWGDLRDQLGKGRPLIVCLGGRANHYVVVAGVDDGSVAVNDPADRKLRRIDKREFEKKWKAVENWTLLAVPRPPS